MKNHHHNGPIHPSSPNDRSEIHAAIAARSYELWEMNGKPENQAEFFWLTAEQEIVNGKRPLPATEPLPVSF